MSRFIKGFLIVIALYHILVTVIQYGIFGWAHPELPAILRDGIRLVFVVWAMLLYVKDITSYLKKWKRPRICLLILIVFSIGVSYIKGKNISDMLVGIKYGFLYLPIFLSATFLGHILYRKDSTTSQLSTAKGFNPQQFLKWIKWFLAVAVILGFVWQVAKFIRPDLFLHIGYRPLNDFKFGISPPMYYLTGYEWTARRQGIFSWPNNYGYFLIALLPAVIVLRKEKRASWKKRTASLASKKTLRNSVVIAVRILAIIVTLSRTAAIGGIVALALLNFQRIKQHKKVARWIVILAIIGILGLSVLKWASTLLHIQAKFGGLKYVIQSPNGYGLGSSWPAIHHNGTILPENYFIQLMLDIGTIGFLLRAICIRQIQRISMEIKRYFAESQEQVYHLRWALTIGWIALLVMGLFLHVFEDSMVNYIFFILRWFTSGYLFSQVKK